MKRTNWGNLVEETYLPKLADIQILIAEMLSQPLTEGCVSRCICKRCGLYGDIEKDYANRLLRIRKSLGAQDDPEIEFGKIYFTTSYCEICASTNEQEDLHIKIKKI